MFGMGIGEIIVILVIALVLIGPRKLPEVARSLGKALGEFKHAADEIRNGFQEDFSQASKPEDSSDQIDEESPPAELPKTKKS
ncbi:MAG: twin-arginine translocase TatA/TatE family subunit [bacterium]